MTKKIIYSKEDDLRKWEDIKNVELVDLLNRCWMTHDAMWFFHCLQQLGIAATNKLNKAAIKSLSAIEIKRVKKILGYTQPINDSEEFEIFFLEASKLIIPEFMNVTFYFPADNQIAWKFNDGKCFAYTGVQRLNVIEKYECGVLYRVKCWLDELGINHRFEPDVGKCHMHFKGNCSGTITLFESKAC